MITVITPGAEFLWEFILCVCVIFCFLVRKRWGIQRLRSAGHASGTPALRGTAFCRAVGTASFYSGESRLVVLRDPAVLVEDHVGPSVQKRVASKVHRVVVAASSVRDPRVVAVEGGKHFNRVSNFAEPHR